MKRQLLIYPDELDRNGKILARTNAFIKKDGTFYLAKGYTGNNPWQQLESSALWIGRQDIGYDFLSQYESYLLQLKATGAKHTKFYTRRRILVEFYGFVLFCRTAQISSINKDSVFFDNTIVPNPIYYGQEPTEEQKRTLYKFYEINDGQDVSLYEQIPDAKNSSRIITNNDEMYHLALEHRTNCGNWHH